MSKTAHTPSNWLAEGPYVFARSDCIGICDTDNATKARMNANAAMMAAAPDMLRALKSVEDYLDGFKRIGNEVELRNIRDAIAKAEAHND